MQGSAGVSTGAWPQHPKSHPTGGRAWMPRLRGGGETSWTSNSPGCRAFRRRPPPGLLLLPCGRHASPSPLLPLLPARPPCCRRAGRRVVERGTWARRAGGLRFGQHRCRCRRRAGLSCKACVRQLASPLLLPSSCWHCHQAAEQRQSLAATGRWCYRAHVQLPAKRCVGLTTT